MVLGIFSKKKTKESEEALKGKAVDSATQDKVLNDPKVKAAMQKAGGDNALADKDVQKAIAEAAKANLTAENAALVAAQCKEWASDPEVQAKARHMAGLAMVMAGQAGNMFVGVIEQGPQGLRFLAFIAGVASCVNAALTVINPMNAIGGIMSYCLSVYQVIFALTTMLFEADPEWVQKLGPKANEYQDMLIKYFKFLTLSLGRGIFYIGQGMLWLSMSGLGNPIGLLIGLYLVFIGALTAAMHWGIMPQNLAAKAREAAASYSSVPTAAP